MGNQLHSLAFERMEKKRKEIVLKLRKIELPEGAETRYCHTIGMPLQISGPTVKNYINGKVNDGYLGEAIFEECIRLKLINHKNK